LPDHSHRRLAYQAGHSGPVYAGILASNWFDPQSSADDTASDPDHAGPTLVAAESGHTISKEPAPAGYGIDIGWRGAIECDPGNEEHRGCRGARSFHRSRIPIVSGHDRCLDTHSVEALSLQIE
jgi:hypothetical protein